MPQTSHAPEAPPACSIQRTLDLIGDRWTLLILRDVFRGVRRFSRIQADLGIARNLLTDRLTRLVAGDILERLAPHVHVAGTTHSRCHLQIARSAPPALQQAHLQPRPQEDPTGQRVLLHGDEAHRHRRPQRAAGCHAGVVGDA
ncbi:MAG: winged helix-turn-helix transcriptional regulator, partial [Acidimicrobiales bacterium]